MLDVLFVYTEDSRRLYGVGYPFSVHLIDDFFCYLSDGLVGNAAPCRDSGIRLYQTFIVDVLPKPLGHLRTVDDPFDGRGKPLFTLSASEFIRDQPDVYSVTAVRNIVNVSDWQITLKSKVGRFFTDGTLTLIFIRPLQFCQKQKIRCSVPRTVKTQYL